MVTDADSTGEDTLAYVTASSLGNPSLRSTFMLVSDILQTGGFCGLLTWLLTVLISRLCNSPRTAITLPGPQRRQSRRSLYLFYLSHVTHRRRREDTDPGVYKKACVGHEHPVRHRIQPEGMGSVVCAYLVQYPICVGIVLLNYR